jgi:hypothetical protein
MNFEKQKLLTQEEKELTKGRILSDAELLKEGAEIKDDGSIEVSREQIEVARKEMGEDMQQSSESDSEKLAEIRGKIHELEREYKYKDPERLLDPNYNLDDLSEGSYRKIQLERMKEYYEEVRNNIKAKPLTELTPQEKKIVRAIENLPISDNDKNDLILVWRGLKPATDLHLDDPKNALIWWWTKRKIDRVLDQMQMHHDDVFYEKHSARSIALSPNRSTFNIMMSEKKRYMDYLENQKHNPDLQYRIDYEKAGMFYGFPETAVKAFVEDHLADASQETSESNRMKREDLPEEIRKVTWFAYSKDNWEEEAKTSVRWAKEIAMVNPKLHEKRYAK